MDMVKIAEHVDLVSLTPLTGGPVLIDKLSGAKNLTIFTEYQAEKSEDQGFANGMLIKDSNSTNEERYQCQSCASW